MKTIFLAALALLLAFAAHAQPLSGAQLAEALRGGGYVIVMRHGATHADLFKPDGAGGISPVARVPIEQWPTLASRS